MFRMIRRTAVTLGTSAMMVLMASAQTQRQREVMYIQDFPGQADVIRLQGRVLVDVQELARITKSSLTYEGNHVILTLPRRDASEQAGSDAEKAGFSPAFRRAAIEAMASIREWGGTLQVVVENGYPVGKAMAGNSIRAYEGRAADSVALVASAASTDSDHRGLELLRNEFNNMQTWAESFVNARNEMRAVNLTTSEHALKDDDEAQKIIHCGQFLAQMFAGNTFEDDAACH